MLCNACLCPFWPAHARAVPRRIGARRPWVVPADRGIGKQRGQADTARMGTGPGADRRTGDAVLGQAPARNRSGETKLERHEGASAHAS